VSSFGGKAIENELAHMFRNFQIVRPTRLIRAAAKESEQQPKERK
jgi:hypothetical protein